MKKTITMVMTAVVASSLQAAPVLVAGWEDFSGSTGYVATQTDGATTASIAATGTAGNWDQWNNTSVNTGLGMGASLDGTFGAFSGATANANGSGGVNLALGNSDGVLVITLTNDSGVDRVMDGFHFDSVYRNNNPAKIYSLAFGGAIAGTALTDQALVKMADGMPAATAAQRDHSIDLSTLLSDSVWEAGQDITFTLAFTGSSNAGGSNGNELLVDNIGVTVIPEPATLGMVAAFGGGILFIRRRFMM